MDDFGISAAAYGCFRAVMATMRRTGRTTRMIERYQDGDRIVFVTEAQARYAVRLARDKYNKEINYAVCDPKYPESIFERPPPTEGRVTFDHVWVEQFYDHEISQIGVHLMRLQDMMSRKARPPRLTPEAEQVRAKFKISP